MLSAQDSKLEWSIPSENLLLYSRRKRFTHNENIVSAHPYYSIICARFEASTCHWANSQLSGKKATISISPLFVRFAVFYTVRWAIPTSLWEKRLVTYTSETNTPKHKHSQSRAKRTHLQQWYTCTMCTVYAVVRWVALWRGKRGENRCAQHTLNNRRTHSHHRANVDINVRNDIQCGACFAAQTTSCWRWWQNRIQIDHTQHAQYGNGIVSLLVTNAADGFLFLSSFIFISHNAHLRCNIDTVECIYGCCTIFFFSWDMTTRLLRCIELQFDLLYANEIN